jgi:hypothetical protein
MVRLTPIGAFFRQRFASQPHQIARASIDAGRIREGVEGPHQLNYLSLGHTYSLPILVKHTRTTRFAHRTSILGPSKILTFPPPDLEMGGKCFVREPGSRNEHDTAKRKVSSKFLDEIHCWIDHSARVLRMQPGRSHHNGEPPHPTLLRILFLCIRQKPPCLAVSESHIPFFLSFHFLSFVYFQFLRGTLL